MKKLILLALLIIPVTSFAASSVRVLGAKPASTSGSSATSAPAAKVLPAKAATTTAAKSGTTSTNSRIGTVRAKPKTTVGTVSTASSGSSTARFPVITPANSYSSVNKPQAAGGTTVVNQNVNLENYYTKDEVDGKLEDQFDDPRFDMIRVGGNPEAHWQGNSKLEGLRGDYVFFWVEE